MPRMVPKKRQRYGQIIFVLPFLDREQLRLSLEQHRRRYQRCEVLSLLLEVGTHQRQLVAVLGCLRLVVCSSLPVHPLTWKRSCVLAIAKESWLVVVLLLLLLLLLPKSDTCYTEFCRASSSSLVP